MYLFPVEERTGNPPVWSEYDLNNLFMPEAESMELIILFVLMLFGSCLGWRSSSSSSSKRGLVEQRVFCSLAKCPLRLSSLSGKCLVIKLGVSPGNVRKLFNITAHRRVEGRGLEIDPTRYLARSWFVFYILRAPLAWW